MDAITPADVSQAIELDYTLTQPVTLQGCSSRRPTGGYSSFAPAATGSNPAGHLVCWSYLAPPRIVRGKAVSSSLASERFACSRKVLMMSAPVRSAPWKLQPVKFVLRIRASRWTLPAKTAPAAWTNTSLARTNPAPLNCELSDAAVRSASMKLASVNVDSARLATLRFARLKRVATATECPMNVPSRPASLKSARLRSHDSSTALSSLACLSVAPVSTVPVSLVPSRFIWSSVAPEKSQSVSSPSKICTLVRLARLKLTDLSVAPNRLIPLRSLPDRSTTPPWATSLRTSSADIWAMPAPPRC